MGAAFLGGKTPQECSQGECGGWGGLSRGTREVSTSQRGCLSRGGAGALDQPLGQPELRPRGIAMPVREVAVLGPLHRGPFLGDGSQGQGSQPLGWVPGPGAPGGP